MRRILENRKFIYLLVAGVFAACAALTGYLYRTDQQKQLIHRRDQVLQQASEVRVGIEQQVNTSLNLTMGLVVYVATHADIKQPEFEAIAARILERARYIKNIGLAKDNVISHLYPLEGNQQAIGLRYMDMPLQREAVIRAIESKDSVIAGPVALVQGGSGFISRIPIFLDKAYTRYWGLASVVMPVDAFFREAGIARFGKDLRLALRGKDSLGEVGELFYGDAGLFEDADPVLLPISLPQGSWLLAAAPHGGWQVGRSRSAMIVGIGIAISLMVSLFLYVLLDLVVALGKANRRAAQASEQKARFFSQMTHELRTPLTAIQGVVGLLASGELEFDKAQSGELLQNALRNCQRLQWIINDILDLKKLESGTASLAMEPLCVSDLIGSAIDAVGQFARQYGIELKVDNRVDDAVKVPGDRARLQQVVINLLGNAIKYSPENARVTLNAVLAPGKLHLEVIDRGEGVSADKLDLIFTEFGQDKVSARSNIASTGLGLSISKQIIEQHGGKIGCRNIETGGCCFFFDLPLGSAVGLQGG